jgi:lipopolysaccharide transport system ATP-binding protein
MPIIEAKNLGKKYSISHHRGGYIALRDVLANAFKNPFGFLKHKVKAMAGLAKDEEFWALKEVNFAIERGEVIGIIGPNGAGKSTLLKILSQITPPSTGEVRINGRVGSLLEVGTGFHPELTGRENIYLNGSILGMSRREIEEKFDEIVAFSGVEKFLDTPVKHYSSGMSVRLAFAVAAHLEPDILIIDEVLAVGDAEFQKKCLGKMNEITKKEGRTILFVSHNMGAIQNLCKRSIVLENGQIKFIGETNKAIDEYLNSNKKFFDIPLKDRMDRNGNGILRFTDIKIESPENSGYLMTGKPFKIKLYFEIDKDYESLKNVSFAVSMNDSINGSSLLVFWTETTSNFDLRKGDNFIECDVENCPLVSGQYFLNVYCTVNGALSDHIINAAKMMIDDTEYFSKGSRDHESHPKYVVRHDWKI